jgi:hypothetical protein
VADADAFVVELVAVVVRDAEHDPKAHRIMLAAIQARLWASWRKQYQEKKCGYFIYVQNFAWNVELTSDIQIRC